MSVTGHRDLTVTQMAWLRPELDRVNLRLVREFGTTEAATGMARGTDLDFGWSALFAGMTLHAHIPYPQQPFDRGWTDADRDSYARLLERCAQPRRMYGPNRATALLFKRNDGLLDFIEDRVGVLVAVWDGRHSGGTYDTVKKAARLDVPVIHFDVERRQVHRPGCSCVRECLHAAERLAQ